MIKDAVVWDVFPIEPTLKLRKGNFGYGLLQNGALFKKK